jgi:hypothetical protein
MIGVPFWDMSREVWTCKIKGESRKYGHKVGTGKFPQKKNLSCWRKRLRDLKREENESDHGIGRQC